MPYDKNTLFNICALCEGTGKVKEVELKNLECVCGGSGFVSSGLITTQFDHYKSRADSSEEALRKLLEYWDSASYCGFCDERDDWYLGSDGHKHRQPLSHDANCPVRKARELLGIVDD